MEKLRAHRVAYSSRWIRLYIIIITNQFIKHSSFISSNAKFTIDWSALPTVDQSLSIPKNRLNVQSVKWSAAAAHHHRAHPMVDQLCSIKPVRTMLVVLPSIGNFRFHQKQTSRDIQIDSHSTFFFIIFQ